MEMKKYCLISAIVTVLLSAVLTACHEVPQYDNDAAGNFDLLWKTVDEHYCFFEEKGVDWEAVGQKYRAQITPGTGQRALFRIMSDMLDELRDGHVNLSSPFETSYYRKWWSDYPQNYNERIVQEHYLYFNYASLGGIDYYLLPCNVGYIRWPSFDYSLGAGNIDNILVQFTSATALIIDIRDNGGGNMTNADNFIAHFIASPICGGYISHKTGPGHRDFSEPRKITINPVTKGHLIWGKPVIVLTNRSTFSAANYFAAVMKSLPHVKIAGATTGGGAGMPFSSELTCGWGVRFSACPILDPAGNLTEFGVEPSEGYAVDMTPEDEANGRDTILDFAIAKLTNLL
ncbi:MAG: S41 family peptidase [Paramuribaculum sp.]|nr:S41 family peptidase [Paramuribaculum sp.]